MSIVGWYYLHEGGDLIYKRELGGTAADIREGGFARAMWPCDPNDRESAWNILVEALALGARHDRVLELAEKWRCTDADAAVYADRLGITLIMDGNAWCAHRSDFINLQESPAGFGETCLEALAKLCKALGYEGGTMWNATFKDLASGNAAPAQEQEKETSK